MRKPPSFSHAHLEAICLALADTATGLTGSEIGRFLAQARVQDQDSENTKWKRLYNALAVRQNADGHGDRILAFISIALAPARYAGKQSVFEGRRQAINVPLAFVGYEFLPDGRFSRVVSATTLPEAESRANRLRAALSSRGVHSEVLKFCKAELVQSNSFHAVLEATKSVATHFRAVSGLSSDGARLVDEALSGDDPILRINAFVSDSEKGEQRGFASLSKGLFGTFRNPTAHEARLTWPMSEEDALDLFTVASYCHRRLDAAVKRR
jgi:uncharacterized protein (TIGR02391 family)